MKDPVIAIYDIGKTNKKIVLFSEDFRIVTEIEEKFAEVVDDDGCAASCCFSDKIVEYAHVIACP